MTISKYFTVAISLQITLMLTKAVNIKPQSSKYFPRSLLKVSICYLKGHVH